MTAQILYIELQDGVVAMVDAADRDLVAGFKWQLRTDGYVAAWHGRMMLMLHRLVVGAAPDELIDHRNMDPLDNRSGNLRVATKAQNAANRNADRRKRGKTSRYKGVSWKSDRGYWVAHAHIDGKTRYLGSFAVEDDAARAYNVAAIEAWGEFARPNVIPGGGDAHARLPSNPLPTR